MFDLQEGNSAPIYEQIEAQFKILIAKQVMKPGEKLPSIRELASMLIINPNTVSKAYQELERQGVIKTIRGKGTFIASILAAPRMRGERINKLKDRLNHIAVEAKHLGLEEQQFIEIVEQICKQWWKDEQL